MPWAEASSSTTAAPSDEIAEAFSSRIDYRASRAGAGRSSRSDPFQKRSTGKQGSREALISDR